MEMFLLFWPLWLYLIFEIAVVVIFLSWINGDLEKPWCWLKGLRKTYFLSGKSEGEYIKETPAKFRSSVQRYDSWGYLQKSVIEINRGLFRRRSAIYGNAARFWKITGGTEFSLPGMVVLENKAGLMVERALKLINTYQSLGDMLDRIAELEKDLGSSQFQCEEFCKRLIETQRELETANDRRWEWLAIVEALLEIIESDRQRYKSEPAQHIRECISRAYSSMRSVREPKADPNTVHKWSSAFNEIIKTARSRSTRVKV